MTYRPGFKQYLILSLLFGVLLGVLGGGLSENFVIGILCGVVGVGLTALVFYLLTHALEKKYEPTRKQLEPAVSVYCSSACSMNGFDGWLFFTDFGLEFYLQAAGVTTRALACPTGRIQTITTKLTRMTVTCTDGERFVLTVNAAPSWKETIDKHLADLKARPEKAINPTEL